MAIVEVTEATFASEVEQATIPVVVDFWASWCNPCKMQTPVLEEIDQEMGDKYKICKVNVDEQQGLAGKFGIMSIPTLLFYKSGKQTDKLIGVQTRETILKALQG